MIKKTKTGLKRVTTFIEVFPITGDGFFTLNKNDVLFYVKIDEKELWDEALTRFGLVYIAPNAKQHCV